MSVMRFSLSHSFSIPTTLGVRCVSCDQNESNSIEFMEHREYVDAGTVALQVVGLSRIARGEVASLCVPAVF